MVAYSVVYSTAEVFLHSRNQKQPPGVLFKKGVKNVTNFTGKQMCWSLIPIKFQAFMPVTLLKRDSDTGVFLWTLQNF